VALSTTEGQEARFLQFCPQIGYIFCVNFIEKTQNAKKA